MMTFQLAVICLFSLVTFQRHFKNLVQPKYCSIVILDDVVDMASCTDKKLLCDAKSLLTISVNASSFLVLNHHMTAHM